MRTTVTIDDELMDRAMDYTGISERATILRMALEQFVANGAEKWLAKLKGSLPDLETPPTATFRQFRIIRQ
ncbi:type II toxin-antitoxin system VapB family antitoxin [Parasphingorhabdus sp.]|uniref:type II toxin-antitoxin system VapB family antitoxin n=1 Tax=Parasphingorhabdus sp. TaxID=2709688 RepID=UPI0035942D33